MCCTIFKHLLYLVCHHFRSYLCQPAECVSLASSPYDSTWNMHMLPQVRGWGFRLIWNAGDGRPGCWSPILWIFDGVNEQENTGLSTLLVRSWNNGGGKGWNIKNCETQEEGCLLCCVRWKGSIWRSLLCVWERQSFSTNECVMTVQFLSIDSLLSLEQNIYIVYLDI